MNHVAIMKKEWNLIPKIISKEKIIESRWYQTRRAPWGNIRCNDVIFFKNSGELVIASAKVSKVIQFIINNKLEVKNIIKKYNKKICLVNPNSETWEKLPKYCILMFLEQAKYLNKPFQINKTGFGISTAWLIVKNIKTIKI